MRVVVVCPTGQKPKTANGIFYFRLAGLSSMTTLMHGAADRKGNILTALQTKQNPIIVCDTLSTTEQGVHTKHENMYFTSSTGRCRASSVPRPRLNATIHPLTPSLRTPRQGWRRCTASPRTIQKTGRWPWLGDVPRGGGGGSQEAERNTVETVNASKSK